MPKEYMSASLKRSESMFLTYEDRISYLKKEIIDTLNHMFEEDNDHEFSRRDLDLVIPFILNLENFQVLKLINLGDYCEFYVFGREDFLVEDKFLIEAHIHTHYLWEKMCETWCLSYDNKLIYDLEEREDFMYYSLLGDSFKFHTSLCDVNKLCKDNLSRFN